VEATYYSSSFHRITCLEQEEYFKIYYTRFLDMKTTIIEESIIRPVATREYDIKGTRYIVRATIRDGANQDAATIVRRLIQKDIRDIHGEN
jgi:hypothetical protein